MKQTSGQDRENHITVYFNNTLQVNVIQPRSNYMYQLEVQTSRSEWISSTPIGYKYLYDDENTCCFSSLESGIFAFREYVT